LQSPENLIVLKDAQYNFRLQYSKYIRLSRMGREKKNIRLKAVTCIYMCGWSVLYIHLVVFFRLYCNNINIDFGDIIHIQFTIIFFVKEYRSTPDTHDQESGTPDGAQSGSHT
jgi:hypothetical protein